MPFTTVYVCLRINFNIRSLRFEKAIPKTDEEQPDTQYNSVCIKRGKVMKRRPRLRAAVMERRSYEAPPPNRRSKLRKVLTRL